MHVRGRGISSATRHEGLVREPLVCGLCGLKCTRLCMLGWVTSSATCPTCYKRCSSMSSVKHFLRGGTLCVPGHHTELSGKPSPQPVQCDFWTVSTELVSSPCNGCTGNNQVCDTIGSRVVLTTHTLDSTSISVSHAPALTRFTRPPQTVGISGSTQPSEFLQHFRENTG